MSKHAEIIVLPPVAKRHTVEQLRTADPATLTEWELEWHLYFAANRGVASSYAYSTGKPMAWLPGERDRALAVSTAA